MSESYTMVIYYTNSCLVVKEVENGLFEVLGEFDPLTLSLNDVKWQETYLSAIAAALVVLTKIEQPLPANFKPLPDANKGKVFINIYSSERKYLCVVMPDESWRKITYSQMWLPGIAQVLRGEEITRDLAKVKIAIDFFCSNYGSGLSTSLLNNGKELQFEIIDSKLPGTTYRTNIKLKD